MATQTILAKNTYFDLLADSQKQFQRLKRESKTVSSRPRKLAATRRNKFLLKRPNTKFTRHKTGYVPESNADLAFGAPDAVSTGASMESQVRPHISYHFIHMIHWSRNGIRRSVFSVPKLQRTDPHAAVSFATSQSAEDAGTIDSDDDLPLSPIQHLGAVEHVLIRPVKSVFQMLEKSRMAIKDNGLWLVFSIHSGETLGDEAVLCEPENEALQNSDNAIQESTFQSSDVSGNSQEVNSPAESYLVLLSPDNRAQSNLCEQSPRSLARLSRKIKFCICACPSQLKESLISLLESPTLLGSSTWARRKDVDSLVACDQNIAASEWNVQELTTAELEKHASAFSDIPEATIRSKSSVCAEPASILRRTVHLEIQRVTFADEQPRITQYDEVKESGSSESGSRSGESSGKFEEESVQMIEYAMESEDSNTKSEATAPLSPEPSSELVRREFEVLEHMKRQFMPVRLPRVSPYCEAIMQLLQLDHLCQSADELVRHLEPINSTRLVAENQYIEGECHTAQERYDSEVESYILQLAGKMRDNQSNGLSPGISEDFNYYAFSDMLFERQHSGTTEGGSAS